MLADRAEMQAELGRESNMAAPAQVVNPETGWQQR